MECKEKIKLIIPNSILELRGKILHDINIKKHKNMSLSEIEHWLSNRYFEIFHVPLDLNNPKRYTEKIQWAKLHAMTPEKSMLSDKYSVRERISSKIGDEFLVPLVGVWDNSQNIDFEKLPGQFVLKSNNASGRNLIVKDKTKLDISRIRNKINNWMNTDFGWEFFEPQYLSIKPIILAETYIENESGDLMDYKFLCFDGKPHFCWVDSGRYSNHKRNVYDLDWNLQPWNQYNYGNTKYPIEKPKNFALMKELASVLSEEFPHVRVDFYNINGKVYFGEMTFTNGAGFEIISPDQHDIMLGTLWNINKEIIQNFTV